jgi:hypothetical protein
VYLPLSLFVFVSHGIVVQVNSFQYMSLYYVKFLFFTVSGCVLPVSRTDWLSNFNKKFRMSTHLFLFKDFEVHYCISHNINLLV